MTVWLITLRYCSTRQSTLLHPDERQLARGIKASDVPARLQAMVDALVWESTRTEEGWVQYISDGIWKP